MKVDNLKGKQFGKLTVIERGPNKDKQTRWLCKCECGNEGLCYAQHLKKGATKSCGCSMITKGSNHVQWTGAGEISGKRWSQIKRAGFSVRKSRKGIPFEISIDYAWRLFLEQNRKCALSGLDLKFGQSNTEETTASLDRIDSSLGYIEGNVQWVHKDINIMKNIFSQNHFINLCKLVAGGCAV